MCQIQLKGKNKEKSGENKIFRVAGKHGFEPPKGKHKSKGKIWGNRVPEEGIEPTLTVKWQKDFILLLIPD
jgi:hypothetical protein